MIVMFYPQHSRVCTIIIACMSDTPRTQTPQHPARLSSAVCGALDDVLAGLEAVRVADRTMAADEDRLAWIEKVTEAERRVSALKTVLIGEADEAGSAMRVRHTPLRDWLAGSGQQSPRQAAAALWKARDLEQRPRVQEAATSGRISLEQASAINQALNLDPPMLMVGWVGRDARMPLRTGSCLLYTSPSPRDRTRSRMPSSA